VEAERILWSHEDGPNAVRWWRRLTGAPLSASALLVRKEGKLYRVKLGKLLLALGGLAQVMQCQ
jgi:hypothetical protein